jgi:hypothetical protein
VSETESVAATEVAPPPEAPSTTEETAVVEETTPQPLSRNMSRRDRVAAMRDRIAKQAEGETPRGPDGRFMAQPEVATEEDAADEEETAAVDEVAATEPEAAAVEVAEPVQDEKAAKPPKLVTIPLDSNHPLYSQGITELKDVPAHLERAMRTMANASVRKQEVDQARAAQQAAETELAMQRARLEVMQHQSETPSPAATPEMQALMADIEQTYPEQVETVKQAFNALSQQAVQAKEVQALQVVEREQVGRRFLSEVQSGANKAYPVWSETGELGERMRISVSQYGDYVDARNANLTAAGRAEQEPSSQEFFSWVDTNYVKDPRVQNKLAAFQKKAESRIGKNKVSKAVAKERQRMATKERQKLAEAAERHGTKPPSTPAVRSQGRVVPATPANEEARQNHGTRQRDLRASIRQRLQQSSA